MKPALKKTFSAILIALASLVIVIGIASLAMVQDGINILPRSDDASATPTLVSDSTKPTDTTGPVDSAQSATPPSTYTCATPEGWMPIIIMPDQTLDDIASMYKTSPEMLQEGNCLEGDEILAGTILFVPMTAQTSQSSAPCGPPAGWVIYYVQPGDTLYGIAAMFGTSANQLINANCLSRTTLYVGQRLYVPPYHVYPIQPIVPAATPWITIPELLTPEIPYLPTGIPFPILPPSP